MKRRGGPRGLGAALRLDLVLDRRDLTDGSPGLRGAQDARARELQEDRGGGHDGPGAAQAHPEKLRDFRADLVLPHAGPPCHGGEAARS